MANEDDLLPVDLELLSADPAVTAVVHRYWSVTPDGSWKYAVKEVAAMAGITPTALNQLVKTSAIARDPEVTCRQCSLGVTASSRTEFTQNKRYAGGRALCAACVEQNRQAERRAQEARQQLLADTVAEQYALVDRDPIDVNRISFRHAVSLLALLRNPIDENFTCSLPLKDWRQEPYATREQDGRERIVELWTEGLLVPHPSTPSSAFAWHTNSDGSEEVGLYADRVRWTARGSGPTGSTNAALVNQLRRALTRSWPDSWMMSWADEWDRTMLEEALAYLELSLNEHRLDISPGPRTHQVLSHALLHFSLGQVYNFIWRAAKDSAAYLQRERIPRQQAANSAIGRIERLVETAQAQEWDVKAYRRDRRLPWSSVSNTLFSTALGIPDAMTATPEAVATIPSEPSDTGDDSAVDEQRDEDGSSSEDNPSS